VLPSMAPICGAPVTVARIENCAALAPVAIAAKNVDAKII